MEQRMRMRGQSQQDKTFTQRLADEFARLKEAADRLPEGSEARAQLLKRARQTKTAAEIDDWLNSPGLRPPKSDTGDRA
jgi:hypothetical protein